MASIFSYYKDSELELLNFEDFQNHYNGERIVDVSNSNLFTLPSWLKQFKTIHTIIAKNMRENEKLGFTFHDKFDGIEVITKTSEISDLFPHTQH